MECRMALLLLTVIAVMELGLLLYSAEVIAELHEEIAAADVIIAESVKLISLMNEERELLLDSFKAAQQGDRASAVAYLILLTHHYSSEVYPQMEKLRRLLEDYYGIETQGDGS